VVVVVGLPVESHQAIGLSAGAQDRDELPVGIDALKTDP